MSKLIGAGLYPIYLRARGNVLRGLSVRCPICREVPGQPCAIDGNRPVVHDAREALAYHGQKTWD